jgi:hypothetical protein
MFETKNSIFKLFNKHKKMFPVFFTDSNLVIMPLMTMEEEN